MNKVVLAWLLFLVIDAWLVLLCVQSYRLYVVEKGYKKALVATASLLMVGFFTFFSYSEFVDIVKRVYPLLTN